MGSDGGHRDGESSPELKRVYDCPVRGDLEGVPVTLETDRNYRAFL